VDSTPTAAAARKRTTCCQGRLTGAAAAKLMTTREGAAEGKDSRVPSRPKEIPGRQPKKGRPPRVVVGGAASSRCCCRRNWRRRRRNWRRRRRHYRHCPKTKERVGRAVWSVAIEETGATSSTSMRNLSAFPSTLASVTNKTCGSVRQTSWRSRFDAHCGREYRSLRASEGSLVSLQHCVHHCRGHCLSDRPRLNPNTPTTAVP